MPTALITGGHAGIGFECAKQLASRSRCNLVLAGQNMERIRAAAEQLRTAYGIRVSTLKLDTSSLSSVREAATTFRAMLDSGEVASFETLLCNAGGYFNGPLSYSTDGYETTFATNCLGHFLLIELLTERMGDNGRIVFTASGTHDPDTTDGKMVGIVAEPDAIALANDGKERKKPLSAGKRYSTSKLCTILYAFLRPRGRARDWTAPDDAKACAVARENSLPEADHETSWRYAGLHQCLWCIPCSGCH